jgi:sortase A
MTSTAVTRYYGTAVIAVLAVVAYLSFTTPVPTGRPTEQATLYARVPHARPGPPPIATGVRPGEALAYLRVPRFGSDWLWVASEGTTMDVLAEGPGHFTGSALPGAPGNTAFAAHRAGHGDPFIDFETLRAGDEVIVAQNGAEWTYRLRFAPRIIDPSESWVTMQHHRDGSRFRVPRLTLVTCWPKYGAARRMFVRATLVTASR